VGRDPSRITEALSAADARRLHFGLLADRDLDPPLGAMRAALEDAMNGRFAPPDRG
jgi:hypothetical protein